MYKLTFTLRIAIAWLVVAICILGFRDGLLRPPGDAGVDPRVAPGDDFFTYANGEWLAKTRIPAGKQRWGARDEIAEETKQRVAQVIREAGNWAPSFEGATSTAAATKVANFYAAYVDEVAIETTGFATLQPLLSTIDEIHDRTDLSRWLGARMLADVDPTGIGTYDSAHVFGFSASYGLHAEREYVAYLTQGGLGLGKREAYLDDTSEARAARARYRVYIARMLKTAGYDESARRADAVLALETAIARTHATAADSSRDANADNHWARGDFQLEAPGIDWPAFFAAARMPKREDFVVWQPTAIKGTAALVASQPIEAWRDYLRFHAIDRYADALPHHYADRANAFRGVTSVRSQRAVEATSRAMPDAVGRLYVAKYFPPEAKARVQAVLENVTASFKRRVEGAAWMSPDSKRVALKKLDTLYFGVGFPDRWQDDSTLEIDAHDALGNLRRVDAWRYRLAIDKLGREVDRCEWAIAAQSPGAILNFQTNSYNFAAALLQPPKFDAGASDAATYGAIGAIFAHEVSHFVDTLGADYDVQGAARKWWTEDDTAGYEVITRPLVAQFAAYHPMPNVAVDGKRTLVENLADLGGLVAAFDAWRGTVGPDVDAETLKRQDREFFLAYARSWRAALKPEAVRAMVKGDSHAPERYRIATVRNLDAWYEAFDVKPGQRLYLEPQERVRVW